MTTTAAVRHSDSRIPMRAPTTAQNRAAIQFSHLRDTGAVSNYSSGHIGVWCSSIEAVRAVRQLAAVFGVDDTSLGNDGMFGRDDRVAVRVDVPFDGVEA